MIRAFPAPLLSLCLLAGGRAPEAPTGVAAEPLSTFPVVTVYDSGSWDTVTDCGRRGVGYECFHVSRFWVDLSVANLAYAKTVGVVWTDDGWKTRHTGLAQYKGALGGDREKWGLDVTYHGGYRPTWGPVEYAAFATQNGETAWDPLDNHRIGVGELDLAHPTQVTETRFAYDPARGGTLMTGTVRALNLAYEKQLTVRVTSDGWRTYRDVDAGFQGGDQFAFSVEGLGLVPGPVEYTIRYRVAGVELWEGRNHTFDPTPRFQEGPANDLPSGAEGLSGNYTPSVTVAGLLPLGGLTCSLDGAPLPTCDTWVYGTNANATAALSTAPLADGPHRLSFRAEATGGYPVTHEVPFTVQNRVTVSDWSPRAGATPVALARDPAGRIFVLYTDGALTRHDGFGQPGTVLAPAEPKLGSTSPFDLAVDARGRPLVLWNAEGTPVVRRLLPDGGLDPSLGAQGTVSLGPGRSCIGQIAAAGDRIFAVDPCNKTLVILDDAGASAGDLSMSAAGYGHGICGDGRSLWLVGSEGALQYQPDPQGLTLVRSTAAAGLPGSPRVACTGGELTLLGDNHVSTLDAAGTVTVLWATGGGSQHDLPGKLDYGSPLVRLDDGSLLGLHQGRIDRLAPRP